MSSYDIVIIGGGPAGLAAAAAAKQEFDTAKLTMVSELTNRDNSEMCARTPDDTALQY